MALQLVVQTINRERDRKTETETETELVYPGISITIGMCKPWRTGGHRGS
jgi:hypothetical protein